MEKIIKKKLLLIVSMLAVTFALAGCSSSDKKVEFDYDGNTLVQIAETQATNYMQVAQVEDVYNFYVDEEANGGQVDETTADALKVFQRLSLTMVNSSSLSRSISKMKMIKQYKKLMTRLLLHYMQNVQKRSYSKGNICRQFGNLQFPEVFSDGSESVFRRRG